VKCGQHLAEFGDARKANAKARGDTFRRSKKVGERRHAGGAALRNGLVEPERRAARNEDAAVNLGHFVDQTDRFTDVRQAFPLFQEAGKGA
jgi:hypothetical protein